MPAPVPGTHPMARGTDVDPDLGVAPSPTPSQAEFLLASRGPRPSRGRT